jgi:sortase (surface protein transpeptidase)
MPPGDAPAPDFPAGVGDDVDMTSTGADTVSAPAPVFQPEPVATGPWGVPPIKLAMPSIGIEAPIVPVGQDEDGAMSAPTDPDTVAWYELGPGMGVPGNVVLAGHINWNGRTRAFGNLDRLDPGDPILVIDTDGHGYQYVVESSHWVRAEGAPVEEIFAIGDAPALTLITCGGEYVAATREYLDRLIVRAKGA